MRTLAACFAAFFITACFNFGNDFNSYCARTGLCDGGTSGGNGGADAQGGGSFGYGGGSAHAGGGSNTGGGGSVGGGTGNPDGGAGGGTTAMQCTTASSCAHPANSTAFCDGGFCEVSCNTGLHLCVDAGACAADTSITQCGASCAMCGAPTMGAAFCDAGACAFSCAAGYAPSGNACVVGPLLTFPDIADITDPNTFIDARIDPSSPTTTLWALEFSGQLMTSTNLGVTAFTPGCTLPGSGLDAVWSGFAQLATARIFISPSTDRTAYVVVGGSSDTAGRIYRADTTNGPCTDITPFAVGTRTLYASAFAASFSVAPDGSLFEFDSDALSGTIRHSGDRGATWTLTGGTAAGNGAAGYLSNTNAQSDVMLNLFQGATTPGLWLLSGGAGALQHVSAAAYGVDATPRFSTFRPLQAYSNHGTVAGAGYFSANTGRTWFQSAVYVVSGDWALDPQTNAAYRLNVYDGGVNVERTSDMQGPSWARTAGGYFPGQGGDTTAPDRIDAIGTTVVAVIGQRLFVSVDSATSFRRVGTLPPVVGRATLDSVDGAHVALVAVKGSSANAFTSVDDGQHYTAMASSPWLGNAFDSTTSLLLQTSVNPGNPQNVIAFAQNPLGATDNPTMLTTHDGFTTATVGNDTNAAIYSNAFSFAPSSPTLAFFYNAGIARSSTSGDAFVAAALSPPIPFGLYPSAQVMGDPTYALVFDNTNGTTYLVDNTTGTDVNITDGGVGLALGNDVATEAEVFSTGFVTRRARVVSRSGFLATSDDNGMTFVAVPGTGTLPVCLKRHIGSLSADRTTVVSWCDTDIFVSRNAGVTWSQPTFGQNWVTYGCAEITSLAVTATQLLVTCSNRPPVNIGY